MGRAETWRRVHAERSALAEDLTGLPEHRWSRPSLCEGMSVREVLAHLTAGASLNPVTWMAGVVRCRFDFDRQVAVRLAEHLGASPAETLSRFRRVRDSRTAPPGPTVAWLGEAVVHSEDIRRPLGLRRAYPVETVTQVSDYYSGSDLVVLAKGRVRGLRLEATDSSFATGSGPLVRGGTLPLVMAMTGRAAYCDELEGDGVALLRERAHLS
jgi:uncharacterized protein (TIGR03083 family)